MRDLLLAQKMHHERGEVSDCTGGPPHPLHEHPPGHPLPAGQGSWPRLKEDQELPGPSALLGHRLAWEQPGFKSYRELLEHHEDRTSAVCPRSRR